MKGLKDKLQGQSWVRLSEVSQLHVVRDGEFCTLGFVTYPHAGMLTFAESRLFLERALALSEVRCVITSPELVDLAPADRGVAVAANPRFVFGEVHNDLAHKTSFYSANAPVQIAPDAAIHPRAYVADYNVRIGRASCIGPNASILEGSIIGSGVTIGPGAVIGASGLQVGSRGDTASDYAHTGSVLIDDGALISTNCVIARGLFHEETYVGQNVRIGNLSFVSHSAAIGARTIVGHGVTVAGHATVGDDVTIGPGVTISDGVKIGNGARVTLGSVVIRDVPARGHVTGNFAVKHRLFLRRQPRGTP